MGKTPISKKVREENSNDPFFKKCCNCGSEQDIEWHHPLSYGKNNKQISDIVVPLCKKCHRGNGLGSIDPVARLWAELWAITRYRDILPIKYPKKNWFQRKRELEFKLKNSL